MATDCLFRGVNWRIHRDGKALAPHAPGEFLYPAYYGIATFGEFTFGASETNAVLTHERDGSRLTSGVSTTPHYNRADFYARTDNGEPCHGYIYKIDRDACARLGIREYRVSVHAPNPRVPEDDEIILVSVDGGPLPAEIVIEIVEVPNGK